MPDFWNLGNTTVRNPERIPGALRVYDKYYDGKKTFKKNEKQQGEFFEKLLNHKNDGTRINPLDPTEIPIYNSLEKKLSMKQDTYNQKNGRMYLSAMNDFGIISAYDSNSFVTPPGKAHLAHPELQGDIWLRQLLKFQIPNHEKKIKDLCIRPAYVILKLMLELDGLTKFELGLVNLTKNEDLGRIKKIILEYRTKRSHAKKNNKITELQNEFKIKQITDYFSDEINARKTNLEDIVNNVQNHKLKNFSEIDEKLDVVVGLGKGSKTPRAIQTKHEIMNLFKKKDFELEKFIHILQNYFLLVKSTTIWIDYVDLNPRYLKMCGMLGWLNREEKGESKFIVLEEYTTLVQSAVDSLKPKPKITDKESEEDYKKYFHDVNQPILEIDDENKLDEEITKLKQKIYKLNPKISIEQVKSDYVSPKRLLYNKLFQQFEKEKEVDFIKKLKHNDIENELKDLLKNYKKFTPTHLESLIWKSILSLGGNKIHPSKSRNFHVDSQYKSIFTAAGDMPDMQFDYGLFDEIIEVTKSEGMTQWKMEQEPVPRHVATHKFYNRKETSCLFIAPSINEDTQERFFQNSKENLKEIVKDIEISVNVIPLSFDHFQKIYSFCISTENPENIWIQTLGELHSLISKSKDRQQWNNNIDKYVGELGTK